MEPGCINYHFNVGSILQTVTPEVIKYNLNTDALCRTKLGRRVFARLVVVLGTVRFSFEVKSGSW